MQLIPELSALRNKELSFGCLLTYKVNGHIRTKPLIFHDDFAHVFDGIDDIDCIEWNYDIIGHPLTRGRVWYLAFSANYSDRSFSLHMNILGIFSDNPILYDQNELQRMESPQWSELKGLLIQFQNILYPNN